MAGRDGDGDHERGRIARGETARMRELLRTRIRDGVEAACALQQYAGNTAPFTSSRRSR